MNLPSFKELFQKLSALKSNTALLMPVILIVIGLLLFIPTRLISNRLGRQMGESLSTLSSIRRMKPVAAEQWKVEQEYQRNYGNDANQIAILAAGTTQREMLNYEIFPKPQGTSTMIFERFGERFRDGIDRLLAGINARDCPSDTELERALQNTPTPSRTGSRGSTSRLRQRNWTRSLRGSAARLHQLDSVVIELLCEEKAKAGTVYANPAEIAGYVYWNEYEYKGVDEAVTDCWYHQLSYWVIEDIISTIAVINSGSESVFTSPVKRLMRVNFSEQNRSFRGSRSRKSSSRGTEDDRPSYVLKAGDGLTQALTGRLCNEDLDVIHFTLVAVVDARSVMAFMDGLCSAKQHKFSGWDGTASPPQTFKHNQITILESVITAVDVEDDDHGLYRYGDDAVMEVELICEYIFNKAACDAVKPDVVKEAIKEAQTTKKSTRRGR